MNDFIKRLAIAVTMMVFIGILIFGGKMIHAEETEGWLWPVDDGIVTDIFGARGGHHNGMDIAAPRGTSVLAAKDGNVKRSYLSSSYGNVIFVLHNNGYETVYAHLSSRLVNKGDHVKKGQVIGKVGSTGHSTGSHLHFEVHHGLWNIDKTNAINPMLVLGDSGNTESVKTISSHVGNDYDKKKSNDDQSHFSKADESEKSNIHSDLSKVHQSKQLNTQSNHSQPVSTKNLDKKVTITIKKGDTLWNLAHHYNVPIDSIAKWNDLSSDLLTIGDKLVIYPDRLETYNVQQGDTIERVASKTGVSVSALVQKNHLKGNDLFPSEILITKINQ